jgi:flagellin-specific chaperone FliS
MNTDAQLNQLEQFLNEDIIVKNISTFPTPDGTIYSFICYETIEAELNTEKAELNKVKNIAKQIRDDENFKKLKNQRQRELYLLECYNIPSKQADDIIEYIKLHELMEA